MGPHRIPSPTRKPDLAWTPLSLYLHFPAPSLTSMSSRGRAFTTGYRGISAPTPGAPPPLLLHWPGCLQSCSFHIFSLHSALSAITSVQYIFSFLNMLSQRHHHHLSLAQPCQTVGSSWTWLALALVDFWQILRDSTSIASWPSLPKPVHTNPAQQGRHEGSRWVCSPSLGWPTRVAEHSCTAMRNNVFLF